MNTIQKIANSAKAVTGGVEFNLAGGLIWFNIRLNFILM